MVEKIAYSVDETAQAIGLHSNTVRKMISEGKLPAIKLGRKYLVSRLELQKWLSGQSNPPAAPGASTP